MAFKILSPEEAKKRARANVAEWLREKEIEEKKASLEKRKAKTETGKEKPEPRSSDNVTRAQNLEVFIPKKPGVTVERALAMADEAKRVIASNIMLDKVLVGSDKWLAIEDALPCWTGTMAAYVNSGEKFGKAVEHVDPETGHRWIFPVPQEHQDKKDAILVAEHPNYMLEIDGNNRIIRAVVVDLIEKFPAEDGWYLADQKHGIPTGYEFDASDQTRYLYRTDSRVGPVARDFYFDDYFYGRYVDLTDMDLFGLGVAVVALPGPSVQFPDTK